MSWRSAARRRIQDIGTATWDGSGAPVRQDLRNAGYIEALNIVNTMNYDVDTAAANDIDVFARLAGGVRRFTVRVGGIGELYDVEGYHSSIISALDSQYRYGGAFRMQPPPYVEPALHVDTGFTARFPFRIPLGLPLASLPFPTGLVQSAVNSIEFSLDTQFNPFLATDGTPGSGLIVGAATTAVSDTSGNIRTHQEYFDPIPRPEDQPSLSFVHKWRSFRFPVSATGDVDTLRLPIGGIYTRMLLTFVTATGGTNYYGTGIAPSASALDRLRLMYGGNSAPYDWQEDEIRARMARQYGIGSNGNQGKIRETIEAGAAAGNIATISSLRFGPKPNDELIKVLHVDFTDASETGADLTSEFSINAVEQINNTGGTATTNGFVIVSWRDMWAGDTFPQGSYVIDLLEETHDEQDAFNSATTTELRITPTIATGETVTGGSFILVTTEELLPITVGRA